MSKPALLELQRPALRTVRRIPLLCAALLAAVIPSGTCSAQMPFESLDVRPIYGERGEEAGRELFRASDGSEYILYDDMYLPLQTVRSASPVAVRKWENGVIPIAFDNNVSAQQQLIFFAACRWWSDSSNLRCIARTNEADHVVVVSSSSNSSFVGRVLGPQPMKIFNWNVQGIIAHEIGHALGLTHEQMRSDRDYHVRVEWANIDPPKRHNFDRIDSLMWSFYDYESIMHYGRTAFSVNGSDTIVPLHVANANRMGQRDSLSRRDRLAAMRMYGPNPANPAIIVPRVVGEDIGRAGVIAALDYGLRTSLLSGPTEGRFIRYTICERAVMRPVVAWQNLAAGSTVPFNSLLELRTMEEWETYFDPPPPGQVCP